MTDFSFIHNTDLRFVIERDFAELQRLSPEHQPKAMVVLAGALLEGMLTDALAVSGRWDFDSACQQALSAMLGPAKIKGIITQDHLSALIKNYRDLVHPGLEVRKRVRLSEHDADHARTTVNVVIQEISRWYESPSGKASIAQKFPTDTVPTDKQRTFLPASERSIDVRIDGAAGNALLITVVNNSDETFDIAGASVEWEGTSLTSVARPQTGRMWTAPAKNQAQLRWPDPCLAMRNLVTNVGNFDRRGYPVSIDFILDCALDDEQRTFSKRVRVKVDPINQSAFQL